MFSPPCMRTTKRGSLARFILAVFTVASCSLAGLLAQTQGQPPVEACKPGDFTVVGYPAEFGPKEDSNFRVLIDEKFNGQFLTTERIWVPVIQETIEKWNGISGSTWNFDTVGLTDKAPDGEDGETTIAACGFQFDCPESVPTLPLGAAANQAILAVTLIFEDESRFRAITDADVFFNPEIPFWTQPSNAQIDFASVLAHELGHVIGLGHNDNCVVGPTVMESIVDLGEIKRDLFSAELEGARFLYPDGSAPAIRIFESESTLRFESAEGLPAPFGQEIHIYGVRGGRWLSEPSQSWVTVKPPKGNFPLDSQIEIEVDTSRLGPGDHTATVALSLEDPGPDPGTLPPGIDPNPATLAQNMPGPPAIIQIEVHIEPKPPAGVEPKLTRQGIVNGANFSSQWLAPGSLFTLFGERMSASTDQAGAFPLPTTLGGTKVLVNAVEAALLFVSPNQINGQVPYGIATGRGGFIVLTGVGRTDSIPIDFSAAAPELFLLENDQAAVLNSDFTLNTPDNPAEQGSKVSVFFSGQGPVDPPVASGRPAPFSPLSYVVGEPAAEIGGLDAKVFFMGLTPGFAGLAQADLEIPTGLFRQLPIRLSIGGVESGKLGFVSVKE